MAPQPTDMVHWIDQQGRQLEPEPYEILLQRVAAGAVPPTTLVWWDGAPGWAPLNHVTGAIGPDTHGSSEAQEAVAAASAALMSGLTDQELDDEFMGLITRSQDMYREAELDTSIGEAMLGGVITALVDCGYALIDLDTANTWVPGGVSSAEVAASAIGAHHHLRFEHPVDRSRVTVAFMLLTPDPAGATVSGHRATATIGYGQRVPNSNQVSQAVRQELQSTSISSEPGTVTFDADLSSGDIFAQVDLLQELERYVGEDLAVDHELLRRHLASVVYTMKTFVEARFGA